jgi:hypothetical protein
MKPADRMPTGHEPVLGQQPVQIRSPNFLNRLDRIDASMFVIRPKQPFQGKKGHLRVITDYQLAIMGDRLFDTLITEPDTNDGQRIELDLVPDGFLLGCQALPLLG